ncbi:putative transposase [Bacillus tianshenii]|uniref:Transposase n=1 Tax=Sutcliffiella tianshenii TaxID=1463404 RepID=A0ABS2NZP7_9BACI|nr:Mu transposase C-terminal domain-containing protein [Bacillus tianshenii]MBM7620163.1 putative transposase [Bacillus tianshenii]
MAKAFLIKGEKFTMHGNDYEINEETASGTFKVQNLTNQVEVIFSRKQLVNNLIEGKLKFERVGKNTEGIHVKTPVFDDVSELPEQYAKEMRFRFKAIEPLLVIGEGESLNPYIMKRLEELKNKGEKGVSRASLYRWLKAYRESEGEMYSLVSSFHNCGPKDNNLQREVEIIIDHMIEKHYMKAERTTIETLHLLIYNHIDEENKNREVDDRLKHPSISTVRRRVKTKDLYEVEKKRKGKLAAFNKHGYVTLQEKPKYPLQRVEADHTRLDIFLVDDETRLPLGRPYITKLIDCFTGYPLGMYIGFEHSSYTTIMHAMKHAFFPKTYLKDKYPSIKNDWVAYGIPENLIVDCGKDFKSNHLADACKEFGINLIHCPPRKPWWKGVIERHFRTQNQQLIHQSFGTTFSNVLDKGEYNPKKHAVIGFKRFLEIYHKWVVDVYGMKKHDGVKGVPSLLWEKSFKDMPLPGFPKSSLDWTIKLMKMGHGTIQNTGIRYQYLFYQSLELKSLGKRLSKGQKVKFKYDPTNLGKIYVWDEKHNRYIEVYCGDQEYSQGLNEYTHKIIIKYARKDVNEVDMSALAAAKASIIHMLEEEKEQTLTKKLQYSRVKGTGSNVELDGKVEENKEKPATSSFQESFSKQEEVSKVHKEIQLFEDDENDWGYVDAR